DGIRVAHFYVFGFGLPVIDEDVVGIFEVAALEEGEAARDGAETVWVDAVNHFDAAAGIELQEGGSNGLDVFLFGEARADFDGHGRATEAEKDRCGRGLDHDVRSDTLNALGGLLEQAGSEANDKHHKGDFDGDGHHADHGPQRAMQQVADDQFAHHYGRSPGLASVAAPTCTSSLPAG